MAQRIDARDGNVEVLDFSPDGQRLFSAGSAPGIRGGVRIWDTSTGLELLTLRLEDNMYALALSPDGRRLATSKTDGTVTTWEVTPLDEANASKPKTGQ